MQLDYIMKWGGSEAIQNLVSEEKSSYHFCGHDDAAEYGHNYVYQTGSLSKISL